MNPKAQYHYDNMEPSDGPELCRVCDRDTCADCGYSEIEHTDYYEGHADPFDLKACSEFVDPTGLCEICLAEMKAEEKET